MTLADVLAGVILVVLVVYVLLGGADFGGGVWDLAARGPRARRHREIIAHAIGPIWEANHVWMIVAVVLLFTCFPRAFAVVMTALHIPVTLMLVGIVLRGSSFVFRKVDPAGEGGPSGWQTVFAVSTLVTPVMIGVVAGTVSTPALGYENGVVTGGFVRPWMAPFPWAVGLFTLALFALLAAVYLTLEADDAALRDDFRRRGLAAAAVALTGGVATALARGAASDLAAHLGGTASGARGRAGRRGEPGRYGAAPRAPPLVRRPGTGRAHHGAGPDGMGMGAPPVAGSGRRGRAPRRRPGRHAAPGGVDPGRRLGDPGAGVRVPVRHVPRARPLPEAHPRRAAGRHRRADGARAR